MEKKCINCKYLAKGESISKGIGGLCLSTNTDKQKVFDTDSCEYWFKKGNKK